MVEGVFWSTGLLNLPIQSDFLFGMKQQHTMCLEYSKWAHPAVALGTDILDLPNLQGEIDRCAISRRSTQSGEAIAGEIPHMALIGYEKNGETQVICGGSLISDNYVITAAYCGQEIARNTTTYFVRMGGLHRTNVTEDTDTQRIPIAEAILYPKYVSGEVYNDIALLRLEYGAQFSWHIRPVCLHTGEPVNMVPLVSAGWGKDPQSKVPNELLRKVKLLETPYEVCKVPYDLKRQFGKSIKNGIDNETMICATHPLGQDSLCNGDGGGPLYYKPEELYCSYRLVGLIGFGGVCKTIQDVPTVFTRIAPYLSWIEAIVWN